MHHASTTDNGVSLLARQPGQAPHLTDEETVTGTEGVESPRLHSAEQSQSQDSCRNQAPAHRSVATYAGREAAPEDHPFLWVGAFPSGIFLSIFIMISFAATAIKNS